jgi:uncharacterized protein YbaP (TraB family)
LIPPRVLAAQNQPAEVPSGSLPQKTNDSPSHIVSPTSVTAASSVEDRLYTELEKLVHEYYKKAKITRTPGKIHFEFKSRPYLNTTTGRQDIIPDFGGVIGDLEFKPGPYKGKVKLPQKYAEYAFYAVILMAPYVSTMNSHIYTRLAYPEGTEHDFTDRFTDLVNQFGDTPPAEPVSEIKINKLPPKAQNAWTGSSTPPVVNQPSGQPLGQTGTRSVVKPPVNRDHVVSEFDRKPALWKATRGTTIVYVFPTISHAKNRYFSLTGEVAKTFKESKAMAVDSYAGLPSDPYTLGCYQGSDKLTDHISPETRKALEELADWTGDTIAIYDVWKPFFLCTSCDSSLIRQIGFNILDLERQLIGEAKKTGKPLIELEPAASRLEYFESLAPDLQDLCLRLSLYDLFEYDKQEVEMENAWRLGNREKMAEAAMLSTKKHPELLPAYDALYQDSNKLMVSTLEDAAKKLSPIFVSLDSRRVTGRRGLLELLREDGFRVEQVYGASNALESGVVTELPYIDSDDGPQPRELTPYGRAAELYKERKFRQALAALGRDRADERSRYLAGLCYLGLEQNALAAGEFRWVMQNAREAKLRDNAEIALRNLR